MKKNSISTVINALTYSLRTYALSVCLLISVSSLTSFASLIIGSSAPTKLEERLIHHISFQEGPQQKATIPPQEFSKKRKVNNSMPRTPHKKHKKQFLDYTYARDKKEGGKRSDMHTQGSYLIADLHQAALEARTDIIKILLDVGADKDLQNKYGFTPLYIAAYKGHVNLVRFLLTAGAKKNVQDSDRFTPLYAAAQNGHLAVVEVLLKAGAEKNTQTKNGFTPLHAAAHKGHTEIVELFLKAGANKDIQNCSGVTALDLARRKDHKAVIELLMQHIPENDKS